MRVTARSTAIAICLTIVVLAPVAASARPAFDLKSTALKWTSMGDVATQGQSPAVQRNPAQPVVVVHHRTVVPPILNPVTASELAGSELAKAHALNDSRSTGGYGTATFTGYGSGHSVSTPKSPSAHPYDGFDWGDAAIGAAATLALTLLVVGGGIALSHRRAAQSDRPNVATTG